MKWDISIPAKPRIWMAKTKNGEFFVFASGLSVQLSYSLSLLATLRLILGYYLGLFGSGITLKGKEAPDYQWSNPQMTLYPERGLEYFREKRKERKYIKKAPTKRHDRQ